MQPQEPISHQTYPHQQHENVHQPIEQNSSYEEPRKQRKVVTIEKGVISQKVQQLLIFAYTAASILLTSRFILSLIGAQQSSPFVGFIYQFTYPLVSPFQNIFGTTLQSGQYRIDFESLVALLVYALVFFGIAKLIGIIFD